jgi:hypothetical protein
MFLGLNPNLNIEDEYIENLLKQIHFMTMEVKLLKEKQQQSEGNSLWGVINRSSQPLVSNIVDSNQKYQNMKKIVDTDLNVLYQLDRKTNTKTFGLVIIKLLLFINSTISKKESLDYKEVNYRPVFYLWRNKAK